MRHAKRFATGRADARVARAQALAADIAGGGVFLAEWGLALSAQDEIVQAQNLIAFRASPDMVGAKGAAASVTGSRAGRAGSFTAEPAKRKLGIAADAACQRVTVGTRLRARRALNMAMRADPTGGDRRSTTCARGWADRATTGVHDDRRARSRLHLDAHHRQWGGDQADAFERHLDLDPVDITEAGEITLQRGRQLRGFLRPFAF